ncbi:MAG: hypothetical protein ACPG8W_14785 [Candidatus Promineifilaceae bacterium]
MPQDKRPQAILTYAKNWKPNDETMSLDVAIDPIKEASGSGSITDTYYLFYHLAQFVSGIQAKSSIEEVLYYSLLGDAITPVPRERRQVFNWWLTNVIPAAYYLKTVNTSIFTPR